MRSMYERNPSRLLKKKGPSTSDPGLLPCPFCGSGITHVVYKGVKTTLFPGTVDNEEDATTVIIRHWCEKPIRHPWSRIDMKGTSKEKAFQMWNRRFEIPIEQEENLNDSVQSEDQNTTKGS